MRLPTLLGLEVLLLGRLAPLQRREGEHLTLPTLQACPPSKIDLVRPGQRAHPRLYIPLEVQRRIAPLRQLARRVRDLVLGFLAAELEDPRLRAFWVGFALAGALRLRLLGGGLDWRVAVDVGVLGGAVGRDDGVPDHGLGGWDGGGGGGVDGGDVQEDLLRVPVEEGAQVCVEVELDVCVFLTLGAVVVWSTFDSVLETHTISRSEPFPRSLDGVWTYTCTFRSSSDAEGDCGHTSTLSAMATPTANTTDVKKPKTFWMRMRLECISAVGTEYWCESRP